MPEIARDDPGSVAELEPFRAGGRAWVAVDADDRPVAYLISAVVDGCAHIEQVSVAPAHARRGLGAALVDHLAAVAAAEGRAALTLTTFRDVPWNAPYYERLGFAWSRRPTRAPSWPRSSPRRPSGSRATRRAWRCGGRSRSPELPHPVAQQRHRRAAGLDPVDLDLGRADHEVGVGGGLVEAGGHVLRRPGRGRAPTGCARPQAMWAAAFSSKSVLLKVTPVSPTREEASTSATSPKRRAPSSMASSARRASSPRRGARLDDLAARDAQLEALDERAAQRERHRAADRALGAHRGAGW